MYAICIICFILMFSIIFTKSLLFLLDGQQLEDGRLQLCPKGDLICGIIIIRGGVATIPVR